MSKIVLSRIQQSDENLLFKKERCYVSEGYYDIQQQELLGPVSH